MNFHVLTLFPEMIKQVFQTSITGRAVDSGRITLETINIRDYTENKHKKVDDYPYGGGAGMLMQAQPVYDAWKALLNRLEQSAGKEPMNCRQRCIYVTPQGHPFTQDMAQELAKEEHLIFLCGHYEGIDERVLEEIVTDYVCVGDYVLTGGELPAMVMMDAIARLVPDVLHNQESAETESFHRHLLEHPHYSRPEVWNGKAVPEVLLSGNHKKIEAWRQEQSILRTRERRPDLYIKYQKIVETTKWLMRDKLLHMDMIDALNRGSATILYTGPAGAALQDKQSGLLLLSAAERETAETVVSAAEETGLPALLHQEFLVRRLQERAVCEGLREYRQAVYTRGAALCAAKEITPARLEAALAKELLHKAGISGAGLLEDSFYGAFIGHAVTGFIGMHQSGSMGVLYVFEEYRRRGIAEALEADCINRLLRAGRAAYCRIPAQDTITMALQDKLGLRISKSGIWSLPALDNHKI